MDITIIASAVRDLSIAEDARSRSMLKVANTGRAKTTVEGMVMMHVKNAINHSRKTANSLDQVTEALERLAVALGKV